MCVCVCVCLSVCLCNVLVFQHFMQKVCLCQHIFVKCHRSVSLFKLWKSKMAISYFYVCTLIQSVSDECSYSHILAKCVTLRSDIKYYFSLCAFRRLGISTWTPPGSGPVVTVAKKLLFSLWRCQTTLPVCSSPSERYNTFNNKEVFFFFF